MGTGQAKANMICESCHVETKRFGKHRNGLQRFRCGQCARTYTEPHDKPLGAMTVPVEKAVLALQLLIEGTSIRSTERVTNLHRDTIMRLLVQVGERCEKLLGRLIVNVPVSDVQCDEIWGYVFKKEKNKGPEEAHNDSIGDAYTFVAIERHSKLVLNFALGRRTHATTDAFIEGLRQATSAHRFQVSTDAFAPYRHAMEDTLSDRVDYGMLVKQYGESPEPEKRYSPAECIGCKKRAVMGNPDKKKICTSHVERQNLTMRMQIKRLARLTLCFSKKWDNLWAALCLHFAYYNLCRIHSSIRVTPAMQAGIADHVWSIRELLH